MHLRLLGALLLAVLAGPATGCGGSADGDEAEGPSLRSNTTVTTDEQLTKAKLVAYANDLCRRMWPFIQGAVSQTHAEGTQVYGMPKPQAYARGVHLSYFASMNYYLYVSIQRRGAPPGERRAVEEIIRTMQEDIERGEREPATASGPKIEAMFADYNPVARRYGLDECLVSGAHLPVDE